MEKKEIREFANSYGWEEGVADLLHMATNADTAEDPESIWKKVEESDSNFDIASLVFAPPNSQAPFLYSNVHCP